MNTATTVRGGQLGFDGRVAIITGAGGGLGRSHALMLAARGARIVVNDRGGTADGSGGDLGPAARVVEEIVALGGEAVGDTNSVSDRTGGQAIVRTALDNFGRIDIVVNNAGILRDKSFHNMTADMWSAVLDVHLNGAFHVTSAAWPHMRAGQFGRVVNTSSGAGIFGNFGQANYGAAKMALVGLTRVLAQEGARHGITVNAIAPVALTRLTEDILGSLGDRFDPGLVSPLVTYLCHESSEATGRIFTVAGGRVAEVFIGEGPGYTDPDLTPESIAENWAAVTDRTDYTVPSSMNDELKVYLARLS